MHLYSNSGDIQLDENQSYKEKALLQQLMQSDEAAFRQVYDHFYLPVFRFAGRFTGNHHAAEDIITDSFLKLWERRAGFTEWNKVRSFLFTAVRNACLNYLRDEKRHAEDHDQLLRMMSPDVEYNMAQHPVAEQVYAYMEEEIGRLSEKMKTILILQLQGHNNNEIAQKMGLAEKTVRNLKVEALKTLRIALLQKESFSLLLFALLFDWHSPKGYC